MAGMSDATASVKYMFDTDEAVPAPSAADPAAVPRERVEAQICELAGQLAAAACRFLVLLADFDARRAGRPGGSSGGTVRARRCGPGRRFRGNVSARGPASTSNTPPGTLPPSWFPFRLDSQAA